MPFLVTRTFFSLVAAAALTASASAAELAPHFDSSAAGTPKSDAGLTLSSERLRIAADIALRNPGGGTEVLPYFSSAFALSARIDLETRLDLAEWNQNAGRLDGRFATRLRIQQPAPFLDELEGRFWRSPDGATGRLVRVAFEQRLTHSRTTPITIRGKATLEKTSALERRVALEAEIRGLKSPTTRGKAALRLNVSCGGGTAPDASRSVSYDRSWTLPSALQVGFNVGMQQTTSPEADVVEPSLGLRWRSEF
jgi:hypothetical protein